MLYNESSPIAFDESSCHWSAPETPNFSAFHWSLHRSLVSTGQHFVTTRVVYLLKRTETSLITESDIITDSDQAMRAVHGGNSWFDCVFVIFKAASSCHILIHQLSSKLA